MAKPDDGGNFGGRIEANIDLSFGDSLRGFHPLEIPASIGTIPLVIIADPVERPSNTLARDARTIRADRDDVEIRRRAFGQGREILLDANQAHLRKNWQDERALDGAPARLAGAQNDLGLERASRRHVGNGRENFGGALRIGRRDIFDLIADLVEGLVLQPRRHSL